MNYQELIPRLEMCLSALYAPGTNSATRAEAQRELLFWTDHEDWRLVFGVSEQVLLRSVSANNNHHLRHYGLTLLRSGLKRFWALPSFTSMDRMQLSQWFIPQLLTPSCLSTSASVATCGQILAIGARTSWPEEWSTLLGDLFDAPHSELHGLALSFLMELLTDMNSGDGLVPAKRRKPILAALRTVAPRLIMLIKSTMQEALLDVRFGGQQQILTPVRAWVVERALQLVGLLCKCVPDVSLAELDAELLAVVEQTVSSSKTSNSAAQAQSRALCLQSLQYLGEALNNKSFGSSPLETASSVVLNQIFTRGARLAGGCARMAREQGLAQLQNSDEEGESAREGETLTEGAATYLQALVKSLPVLQQRMRVSDVRPSLQLMGEAALQLLGVPHAPTVLLALDCVFKLADEWKEILVTVTPVLAVLCTFPVPPSAFHNGLVTINEAMTTHDEALALLIGSSTYDQIFGAHWNSRLLMSAYHSFVEHQRENDAFDMPTHVFEATSLSQAQFERSLTQYTDMYVAFDAYFKDQWVKIKSSIFTSLSTKRDPHLTNSIGPLFNAFKTSLVSVQAITNADAVVSCIFKRCGESLRVPYYPRMAAQNTPLGRAMEALCSVTNAATLSFSEASTLASCVEARRKGQAVLPNISKEQFDENCSKGEAYMSSYAAISAEMLSLPLMLFDLIAHANNNKDATWHQQQNVPVPNANIRHAVRHALRLELTRVAVLSSLSNVAELLSIDNHISPICMHLLSCAVVGLNVSATNPSELDDPVRSAWLKEDGGTDLEKLRCDALKALALWAKRISLTNQGSASGHSLLEKLFHTACEVKQKLDASGGSLNSSANTALELTIVVLSRLTDSLPDSTVLTNVAMSLCQTGASHLLNPSSVLVPYLANFTPSPFNKMLHEADIASFGAVLVNHAQEDSGFISTLTAHLTSLASLIEASTPAPLSDYDSRVASLTHSIPFKHKQSPIHELLCELIYPVILTVEKLTCAAGYFEWRQLKNNSNSNSSNKSMAVMTDEELLSTDVRLEAVAAAFLPPASSTPSTLSDEQQRVSNILFGQDQKHLRAPMTGLRVAAYKLLGSFGPWLLQTPNQVPIVARHFLMASPLFAETNFLTPIYGVSNEEFSTSMLLMTDLWRHGLIPLFSLKNCRQSLPPYHSCHNGVYYAFGASTMPSPLSASLSELYANEQRRYWTMIKSTVTLLIERTIAKLVRKNEAQGRLTQAGQKDGCSRKQRKPQPFNEELDDELEAWYQHCLTTFNRQMAAVLCCLIAPCDEDMKVLLVESDAWSLAVWANSALALAATSPDGSTVHRLLSALKSFTVQVNQSLGNSGGAAEACALLLQPLLSGEFSVVASRCQPTNSAVVAAAVKNNNKNDANCTQSNKELTSYGPLLLEEITHVLLNKYDMERKKQDRPRAPGNLREVMPRLAEVLRNSRVTREASSRTAALVDVYTAALFDESTMIKTVSRDLVSFRWNAPESRTDETVFTEFLQHNTMKTALQKLLMTNIEQNNVVDSMFSIIMNAKFSTQEELTQVFAYYNMPL